MGNINVSTISPDEAIEAIKAVYQTRRSVMLWGPPGNGKSMSVQRAAEELDIAFLDVRMSTKTAADTGGLPALDHETKQTRFYLPDYLPVDTGRHAAKGILFFDELTTCQDDQALATVYGILQERRAPNGQAILPGWMIVGAGNRTCDGAISRDLGTALNNRLIHLQVEANTQQWLRWAAFQKLHPAVIGYIRAFPENLQPTEQDLAEDNVAFPTPRSWHMVSDVMYAIKDARLRTKTIPGAIGQTIGTDFLTKAEELEQYITVDELLKTPKEQLLGKLPKTINGLWMLAYGLVGAIEADDTARTGRILDICEAITEIKPDSGRSLPTQEISDLAYTLVTERAFKFSQNCATHPGWDAWAKRSNRIARRAA